MSLLFCIMFLTSASYAADTHHQTNYHRQQIHNKKSTAHKTNKKAPKKTRAQSSRKVINKPKALKVKHPKKTTVKNKTKPNVRPFGAKKSIGSIPAVPQKINLVTSIQQRLVRFVQNTVDNIRYSAYKLGGTRFDPSRGIYVVDCSSYVDRVLQTVHPRAFSKLVNYSGSVKPTTHDYYQFFNNLTDEPQHYWDTVDDVAKLRPGDLLVFRYKNEPESVTKGHIVIVMEKPIRNNDIYRVRIADAAPVRHSQDTRLPRVSGIGIGTMLLKVNPKTYRPFAYAWGVNSKWERNVRFAMARPIDLNS